MLERLLNSFAQDLIVPDALYSRVSEYVNDHHLGGRLVYQRVDPSRSPARQHDQHSHHGTMVYEKLHVRPQTPYGDWLAARLINKFAYLCCESLVEFQQSDRAITPQGQIKHSATHHEKDDRRNLQDRSYYVLGWDNREKLRQLELELDDLHRQLRKLQERLESIDQQLERRRRDIRALENLLEIQTFDEIDWRSTQVEVDRLRKQLSELDDSKLRQLEQQRDQLRQMVKDAQAQRDDLISRMTTLTNQINGYHDLLQKAKAALNSITDEDERLWQQVGNVLKEVDTEDLTVDKVGSRTSTLAVSIQNSINTFKGHQTRYQATILDAMNTFRREYADEGASLTADIAALAAFEAIYRRLETDDLPHYEERFKQMLDRTVTRGVMAFYSNLDEQERNIDKSIAELNMSLAQVDYGNGSIIHLIAEKSPDAEINDFKRELKACIPHAGDNSYEELERAYNRIKALIDRFDTDPGWMRRVIDVRRWRVFAAEQIDATGRQMDYYSDSSGKSGGQKAKLAYTILASAIAYQYGLQEISSTERSFRLVVIDEAFSKLDDDNARFAMQLFEKLGLQLLVVTPMQQLHVIENYVKAYHVVVNNEEGNYSRLFNLTYAEYAERRREFQAR